MPHFSNNDVSLDIEKEGALDRAIRDAFTIDELKPILYYDMGGVVLAEITQGTNNATMRFELIQWLKRQGRVGEFARIAYQHNTGNPSLHEFAKSIGLVAEAPPKERLAQILEHFTSEFDMAPNLPQTQQFERMLEAFARDLNLRPAAQSKPALSARYELVASPYVDLSTLSEWLSDAQKRVCRVEIDGQMRTTGFLVGPSQVLTVYHGIEEVMAQGGWSRVRCRFDFIIKNDVIREGKTIKLALNEPLLDYASYSPHENEVREQFDYDDEAQAPGVGEGDYALLNLENPLGHDRGWHSLHDAALEQESKMFVILHHPRGEPLKCSFGELLRSNTNNTRYQHLTRTEPGSAGGPCFDLYGKLVGMHHAMDPGWNLDIRFGRAIPAVLIQSLLDEHGVEIT
ncbi:MAG: serine protease [Chloroflexota bacterium]